MGLDTVELILEVEDEFSIRIPDSEAINIRTVGELAQLVVNLVTEENAIDLSYEDVFAKLKEILVNNYAVDQEIITPNAQFVRDLRLD